MNYTIAHYKRGSTTIRRYLSQTNTCKEMKRMEYHANNLEKRPGLEYYVIGPYVDIKKKKTVPAFEATEQVTKEIVIVSIKSETNTSETHACRNCACSVIGAIVVCEGE